MIEAGHAVVFAVAAGIATSLLAHLRYKQGLQRGYAKGWIERAEDHGPEYPMEIARESDRRRERGETLDQLTPRECDDLSPDPEDQDGDGDD